MKVNKLIPTILVSALPLVSIAADSIPQWQKNEIRERIQTEVMNRPAKISNMSAEEVLLRRYNKPTAMVDEIQYPEIKELPSFRAFQSQPLSFKNMVRVISKSSGLDEPIFLPAISNETLEMKIPLNHKMNRLADLLDYLQYVTGTDIRIYPESKMILIAPRLES